MKKNKMVLAVGLALSGLMVTQIVVEAGITGVSLGTGAPPLTLGGWTMTAFPADTVNPVYQASNADVTAVPGPGGGLTFSQALTHDIAGNVNTGWATWSHGYAGDVYDTIDSADPTSVTLGLPAATHAFYLYVEPAPYDWYTITATAQDGTGFSQTVFGGGGATGFGFYGASGADVLTSITISGLNTDFAIGEFGISAVPEPSTMIAGALMLLPFGLQGMRCLRNRKQVSGN